MRHAGVAAGTPSIDADELNNRFWQQFFEVHLGTMNDVLVKAVHLALADRWHEAHGLVQQLEADATAAWIHAVLHKIEGDLDNSRYWYRRANKLQHLADEPRAELTLIQQQLTPAPE